MNLAELTITLSCSGDWWSATCDELECAGFGPNQEEAMKNLVSSISTTVASRVLKTLTGGGLKAAGAAIEQNTDHTTQVKARMWGVYEAVTA